MIKAVGRNTSQIFEPECEEEEINGFSQTQGKNIHNKEKRKR